MSEWRQFRLLVRTSIGRLMDVALASRDTDATQFAIWSLALLITPSFLYGVKMFGKYNWLARRPDVLERVVLVDRLFYIVYAMLACALLASMLWDALFPDRQDQEVVGVLPVRPRTLAAARFITALGAAIILSASVAVSSGFMYTFNVASAFKVAHIVGWWPTTFVAHVITTAMAGVFMFAVLLALRGVAVAVIGAEAAQRAAAVLQLVTVVLLVEVFIFLPTVLMGLASELANPANAEKLPPLWFLGLYTTIAGPATSYVPGLASLAIVTTVALVALAAAMYVLPARWNARRTLEALLKDHAGHTIAMAQRLASPLLPHPASRAVFAFVLASLARSRRHALIVATYLGIALAMAGVRLMAAMVRGRPLALNEPADYLLSIPLVLTFFLVMGLRAAFAVPTDTEANWTFRVAQPRAIGPCIHGVGVAMVGVAVLPVTIVWLLITASLWDLRAAMAAATMHLACGLILVELTLINCHGVPFTRPHVAASSGVRAGWAIMLVALHLYAFRLDDIQLAALDSPLGVTIFATAAALATVAVRAYRLSRRRDLLEFDAPVEGAPATLNLSQSLG
jgi:hypothetical protein